MGPTLLGFNEYRRGGHRVLGHDGDTVWFHSALRLIPGHRTGLFISYNTDGRRGARARFLTAFFERYFPAQARPPVAARVSTVPGSSIAKVLGRYLSLRAPSRSVAGLSRLSSHLIVQAARGGGLILTEPGLPARQLDELSPLLFRDSASGELVGFHQGAGGAISHMFVGRQPSQTYAALGAVWSPGAQVAMLLVLLLVAITALFPGRAREVMRFRRWTPGGSLRLAALLLASAAALLLVVCFVGTAHGLTDKTRLIYGVPAMMQGLVWLAVAAIPLLLASAAITIGSWRSRAWTRWTRVHHAAVIAALAGLLVWLDRWDMLVP